MAKKKKQFAYVNLNLTSMMDIVFQLIIFFLLITNFVTNEQPKLEPPAPVESKAIDLTQRAKVTVNLMPVLNKATQKADGSGLPSGVKVGITAIETGDYGKLTALLKEEVDINPEVEIDLRVDKSIRFEHVQPVMSAITNAKIGKINLVAYSKDKQPAP